MKKIALAVALMAAGVVAQAAPVLGSTINYQYYFPNISSPHAGADNGNKVVGAGIEVTNVASGVATLDISANQILVDFSGNASWIPAAFSGFVIRDAFGTIDAFTGFTINAATNMAGLDASRLAFTADTLSVNWQGLSFSPSTQVVLNFTTANNVPEPASLALVGLGLLGLAAARKRKQI